MKKQTRTVTTLLTAAMMLVFAGCNGSKPAETSESATEKPAETSASTEAATEPTTEATSEDVVDADTGEDVDEDPVDAEYPSEPDTVRVAALKGPTAMGMINFMNDSDNDPASIYDFTIYAAVDEISPLLIKGEVDIACVPANLASVLYNKTEGAVDVLAINTLGVIYIVENGTESVNSVADLKGKTIYASGKGATPEFAINYILKENGIDPENDVNIEWKTEHAECLTAITENEGGIAMLPQPFVTTGMMKNEGIRVALDLTEEWDKLGNGSSMITGVVVGRKEFLDAYPDAVNDFMIRYSDSVASVNSDVDGAAALIGKYDIVPEAVAKKAIPACNIVCITGSEMKEKLSGYLQVLYDSLDTSVGGKLPADDFYYAG